MCRWLHLLVGEGGFSKRGAPAPTQTLSGSGYSFPLGKHQPDAMEPELLETLSLVDKRRAWVSYGIMPINLRVALENADCVEKTGS